jgi:hypothetical protein
MMNLNKKATVLIHMLMADQGLTEKVVLPIKQADGSTPPPAFRATEVMRELDSREPMRSLLRMMFTGWILHEESYEQRTESTIQATRSEEDAMIEACGGDALLGQLLCLFGHWSNDVTSSAAHYGLEIVRVGPDGEEWRLDNTLDTLLKPGKMKIRDDVPAPPTGAHWWHKGEWRAPAVESLDG